VDLDRCNAVAAAVGLPCTRCRPLFRPDAAIIYQTPPHARPGYRLGGSAHPGDNDDLPCLLVLAPDHIGQTVQDRPAVLYYLSKATDKRLHVTIAHADDPHPVLDMTIDPKPGIQWIDMSNFDFALALGEHYKVSLTLVMDPADPARNIYSGCEIERIDPPYTLLAELGRRADLREKSIVFAHNGIWFDALAALSQKIDAVAQNKSLREDRARLLEQEGLTEAADFDRTFVHAAIDTQNLFARAAD